MYPYLSVSKEKGKPKGRNHINSIEGFWSYAKHWLYQYRGIPNPASCGIIFI